MTHRNLICLRSWKDCNQHPSALTPCSSVWEVDEPDICTTSLSLDCFNTHVQIRLHTWKLAGTGVQSFSGCLPFYFYACAYYEKYVYELQCEQWSKQGMNSTPKGTPTCTVSVVASGGQSHVTVNNGRPQQTTRVSGQQVLGRILVTPLHTIARPTLVLRSGGSIISTEKCKKE